MRTGSHIQAEFKGRHEKEYRWFSVGNAIPGFSMSAGGGPQILDASAHGDAEIVLTFPRRRRWSSTRSSPGWCRRSRLANRFILPEPGGVGPQRVKGYASRGQTPDAATALSDRASARSNEVRPGITPPPPLPTGR